MYKLSGMMRFGVKTEYRQFAGLSPYACGQLGMSGEKEHYSGWTIKGEVREDWFKWTQEFYAHHEIFGDLWGDYNGTVYAYSQKAYNHFYENHPPIFFDSRDI